MMVEAEKFSLCMLIWRMKKWLLLPSEESFPLQCPRISDYIGVDCGCKQLLQAMWTNDILKLGTMHSKVVFFKTNVTLFVEIFHRSRNCRYGRR